MMFNQIIKELKKGKKVKRSRWLKNDYIILAKNKLIDDGGHEYRLSYAEIKAKNWEVKSKC